MANVKGASMTEACQLQQQQQHTNKQIFIFIMSESAMFDVMK